MKKITILLVMLLSITSIAIAQKNTTKKQLPPFTVFEIPFYNWFGNGFAYYVDGDVCPGLQCEGASYDYRTLIFNYIQSSDKKEYGDYGYMPISQEYIKTNNIKAIYSARSNYFDAVPGDTAMEMNTPTYTFDKLGRIQSFYRDDTPYTCKYLNNSQVQIYCGDAIVSTIQFSKGKITHKKTMPFEALSTYEYYYSYTDFGYPLQIVCKQSWEEMETIVLENEDDSEELEDEEIIYEENDDGSFKIIKVRPTGKIVYVKKDTISFEYDFGDTIKITRKKETGKDVFHYRWDGTLLRYEFLYDYQMEYDSIIRNHTIINTVGDFHYEIDVVNNENLERVHFTEFYKYGYRSEPAQDYSATNADWHLSYQYNKLKEIRSQVTSFNYSDRWTREDKYIMPYDISFFDPEMSHILVQTFDYNYNNKYDYANKNVKAITNDYTEFSLFGLHNRGFRKFYRIEYYE